MKATIGRALPDKALPRHRKCTAYDFSKYCGGWSQKEHDDFETAIADCEKIVREDWR